MAEAEITKPHSTYCQKRDQFVPGIHGFEALSNSLRNGFSLLLKLRDKSRAAILDLHENLQFFSINIRQAAA
ncbi:hypothetical protein D3C77_765920 [compost metagenome]